MCVCMSQTWHPFIKGKKKIALKKKESCNLSHQYNEEFAQFTLYIFVCICFCLIFMAQTWHVSMTKGVANQSWSKTYNVRELSIVLHCVFSTTISRLICTIAQGFVFCSLHISKHTWPSGHINVKLNPTGGAGWSSVKSSIWSLSWRRMYCIFISF